MFKKRSSLKLPRARAFKLQNGRCYYCNFPMWIDCADEFGRLHGVTRKQLALFRCTGEHLKPHAEGGSARQDNIVAACAFCNRARHRRKKVPSPDAFRLHVATRVRSGRWKPTRKMTGIAFQRAVPV